MTEYSKIAKGSFTAGASQTSAVINLPFQPDYVEVWNLTNIGNAGSAGNITRAWWDNNIPPFTPSGKSASQTMVEVYQSSTSVIFDTIYTNGVTGGTAPASGITSFSGGLSQQFGAAQQIASIAKSTSPTVVTTVNNHGYNVGDTVIMRGLFQSSTTGMPQINGVPFTITAVTSNTFSIQWNSNGSAYTALSGSPASAYVQKVLYPFLYAPEDNVIAAITPGTTTTIVTTMYHNFEPGQEVAFRIPNAWGTTQLNSLPNNTIPGSPVYGYVVSVTDNWTFVVNINSSAYTAYTNNITVANVVGLSYPQVLSVGDVNNGGLSIYTSGVSGFTTNSPLYPPPNFPTSTNRVPTINGPAVKGAFVNNTAQGFIIGNGTPQQQAGTGTIVTASSIILWHAYLHDYASP